MTTLREAARQGLAFPTDSVHQSSAQTWHFDGMTLRDYFAAKALPVAYDFWRRDLVGNPNNHDAHWDQMDSWVEGAYELADAMLAERSKP
jgi:hypothetical protein